MEKNQSIDFLELLYIMAKYRKFIFFTVLIVSILSVTFVLLTPQYWKSTATLLPADENTGGISLSGYGLLGSSLLGGSRQANSLELVTFMTSHSFTDDIIRKFNLVEYFEIDDPDSLVVRELASKAFRENVRKMSISEETGLVSISIETKDKFLSAEIANYIVDKLEEFNQQKRNTNGRQQREFLQSRLAQIEKERLALLSQLNTFQQSHNVIEIEQQTTMIIQLYSELLIEKSKSDIELEYAQKTQSKDSPLLEQLRIRQNILRQKIDAMEHPVEKRDTKYILSMDSLSGLAIDYANIKLNLEVLEQVYAFLYPQLEQAKLQEIKDLPTITVIDRALPAGLRSKPKRARFCIIAFMLALFVSTLFAFLYDRLNTEDNRIKFGLIRKELKKK